MGAERCPYPWYDDRVTVLRGDGWKGATKWTDLVKAPVFFGNRPAILVLDEADKLLMPRYDSGGENVAPAFDANAQQYVIDHLDDMIRIRQESYEQRKAYLAEKLEKLETSSGQPSARKPVPQGGKEAGPLRQLDIVKRVYDYLDRLVRNMDPITQAALPAGSAAGEDSVRALMRACFAFVAQCLGRALNAGTYSAKVPFFLPPEVRPNIHPFPGPVGMKALLDAINAQLEDKTAMRLLNPRTLRKYLLAQGVLDEVTDEEGKKRSVPGPRGEELEVTQCEREVSPEKGGTYLQVVYGPAAQQFVIDHLDELAALQAKK